MLEKTTYEIRETYRKILLSFMKRFRRFGTLSVTENGNQLTEYPGKFQYTLLRGRFKGKDVEELERVRLRDRIRISAVSQVSMCIVLRNNAHGDLRQQQLKCTKI